MWFPRSSSSTNDAVHMMRHMVRCWCCTVYPNTRVHTAHNALPIPTPVAHKHSRHHPHPRQHSHLRPEDPTGRSAPQQATHTDHRTQHTTPVGDATHPPPPEHTSSKQDMHSLDQPPSPAQPAQATLQEPVSSQGQQASPRHSWDEADVGDAHGRARAAPVPQEATIRSYPLSDNQSSPSSATSSHSTGSVKIRRRRAFVDDAQV